MTPFSRTTSLCLALLLLQASAQGTNFLTQQCSDDSDCASGCCGFNTGLCAGAVIAQERDGGCGFSASVPNSDAAQDFGYMPPMESSAATLKPRTVEAFSPGPLFPWDPVPSPVAQPPPEGHDTPAPLFANVPSMQSGMPAVKSRADGDDSSRRSSLNKVDVGLEVYGFTPPNKSNSPPPTEAEIPTEDLKPKPDGPPTTFDEVPPPDNTTPEIDAPDPISNDPPPPPMQSGFLAVKPRDIKPRGRYDARRLGRSYISLGGNSDLSVLGMGRGPVQGPGVVSGTPPPRVVGGVLRPDQSDMPQGPPSDNASMDNELGRGPGTSVDGDGSELPIFQPPPVAGDVLVEPTRTSGNDGTSDTIPPVYVSDYAVPPPNRPRYSQDDIRPQPPALRRSLHERRQDWSNPNLYQSVDYSQVDWSKVSYADAPQQSQPI